MVLEEFWQLVFQLGRILLMSVLQSRRVLGRGLAALEDVTTIKEFKAQAKKVLLMDDRLIDEVINIARRKFHSKDGGDQLVGRLCSLSDRLRVANSNEACQKYIKRALRRAGATTDFLLS